MDEVTSMESAFELAILNGEHKQRRPREIWQDHAEKVITNMRFLGSHQQIIVRHRKRRLTSFLYGKVLLRYATLNVFAHKYLILPLIK